MGLSLGQGLCLYAWLDLMVTEAITLCVSIVPSMKQRQQQGLVWM